MNGKWTGETDANQSLLDTHGPRPPAQSRAATFAGSRMKRYVNIVVAVIAPILLVMVLFGIIASLTVPFSHTAVPFRTALGSLVLVSMSNLFGCLPFWFVPIAAGLLATFLLCSREAVRIAIAITSFVLPMLFLDPSRAIAQFLFLPFVAVSTTIGMFAGSLDGETWSEGFVGLEAAAWWSMLWSVVLVAELVRGRIETYERPANTDVIAVNRAEISK